MTYDCFWRGRRSEAADRATTAVGAAVVAPRTAARFGGSRRAAVQLPLLHYPWRSRLAPQPHRRAGSTGAGGRPARSGQTPRERRRLGRAALAASANTAIARWSTILGRAPPTGLMESQRPSLYRASRGRPTPGQPAARAP